jgi:hypothetical protein
MLTNVAINSPDTASQILTVEHLLEFARSVDNLIDGPGQYLPQGFTQHRSRGFGDGHQLAECRVTRAGLFQLAGE